MTSHIGIVGVSAEGAALCYRTICAEAAAPIGTPHAHPTVTMHTRSLAEYVACLDRGDDEGVARLMLESAAALARAGADFVVCPDNTVHRAFDLVPDFAEAMEVAVELGFERILTSGGARSAPQAIDRLSEIVDLAKGRLSIMPGSGVTLDTVDGLLDRLTVGEVHSSCSVRDPAQDRRLVEMGFVSADRRRTDLETVRAMKARLSAR